MKLINEQAKRKGSISNVLINQVLTSERARAFSSNFSFNINIIVCERASERARITKRKLAYAFNDYAQVNLASRERARFFHWHRPHTYKLANKQLINVDDDEQV